MYEDKTLVCKDCGAEFVFTAGEQEFYAAQNAESPLRFPSSPERIAPYTAANALQHAADNRKTGRNPEEQLLFRVSSFIM